MSNQTKVILTFDLGTPAGREALDTVISSHELLSAVREVDNLLRSKLKYNDVSPEVSSALEEIRSCLREELPARIKEFL